MQEIKIETKVNTPQATPKYVKLIQENLAPLNTLYLIPVSLAAIFDLVSPYGPFLIVASILAGLFAIYKFLFRNRIANLNAHLGKTRFFIFGIFSFLVFSASATANFIHKSDGGALANWIPSLKKWQDAYLVSIKKDTEEINKKLDETNLILTQAMQSLRPQLEKPLIEEIPSYTKLAPNQKDALVLFTQKVGTNGIRKYRSLISAINRYTDNPSNANASMVADHFIYIVSVNGINIEDRKTNFLIKALFLSPETYSYLVGLGPAPVDTTLLQEFHIDINKPLEDQLADPLGEVINRYLNENGVAPVQKVYIPKGENLGPGKGAPSAPQNQPGKMLPQRPANFNHRYM